MDQYSSPTVQSQYLQSRLNDKRAESLWASASSRRASRARSGRDDDIFDDPENAATKRRGSAFNTPSPASLAPATSTAYQRRLSGLQRPMGAREMDEYVDKLSKQNFDLKLELYHRREKAEELEKRLATLSRIEQDYYEALQLNEELVGELDKRDIALDEAVVMITQLEGALARATTSHLNIRPSSRPSTAGTATIPTTTSRSHASNSPSLHLSTRSNQDRAHPHPLPEIPIAPITTTKPPIMPSPRQALQVPSFMRDAAPTTTTLRSLYMDGDQVIRDIPSQNSLLSRSTKVEGDLPEVPRSPVLSELSESDFKSIYGLDDSRSPDTHTFRDYDDEPDSPSRGASRLKPRRLARGDPIIPDTVASEHANNRQPSGNALVFQSLGNVLHQGSDANSEAIGLAQARRFERMRLAESKATPPILTNPLFGQNTFPPTPDTMLTRPSNDSNPSVIQERSFQPRYSTAVDTYSSLLRSQLPPNSLPSQNSSNLLERSSLLPKEIDAYGDGFSDDDASWDRRSGRLISTDLFRSSSTRARKSDFRASGMAYANTTSQLDGDLPANRPASQAPRLTRVRRLSVEDFPQKPTRQLTRSISTILTPQRDSFVDTQTDQKQSRHERSISDITSQPRAAQPTVQELPKQYAPSNKSHDAGSTSSVTQEVAPNASPASSRRSETLRDRVRNLARRNNVPRSSSASDTMQRSMSMSTRRRGSRSESAGRRFFQRRGSAVDDEDKGTSLRAAAVAAAPFLSFDINKDAISTTSPASTEKSGRAPQNYGMRTSLSRPRLNSRAQAESEGDGGVSVSFTSQTTISDTTQGSEREEQLAGKRWR